MLFTVFSFWVVMVISRLLRIFYCLLVISTAFCLLVKTYGVAYINFFIYYHFSINCLQLTYSYFHLLSTIYCFLLSVYYLLTTIHIYCMLSSTCHSPLSPTIYHSTFKLLPSLLSTTYHLPRLLQLSTTWPLPLICHHLTTLYLLSHTISKLPCVI